ncbi:MAG: hypothetical protein AAFY71_15085 [Bacteroidota bacterium]
MSLAYLTKQDEVIFSFGDFTSEMCLTQESFEEAMRFRYACYDESGLPTGEEGQKGSFQDAFDLQENARIILIRKNGQPVGTIRNMVYCKEYSWLPTYITTYHKEKLRTPFQEEQAFLESSRFAITSQLEGRDSRIIQGLLFRTQDLANWAERTAYFLTQVRDSHAKFYHRYMHFYADSETIMDIGLNTVIMRVDPPFRCDFPYSSYEFLKLDPYVIQAAYMNCLRKRKHFQPNTTVKP